jgi:hypothetical protein
MKMVPLMPSKLLVATGLTTRSYTSQLSSTSEKQASKMKLNLVPYDIFFLLCNSC